MSGYNLDGYGEQARGCLLRVYIIIGGAGVLLMLLCWLKG